MGKRSTLLVPALLGSLLASFLLAACGGAGGGGGGPIAVQDEALIGEWAMTDFEVWDYSTGDHWTGDDFGDYDGYLMLNPDGTGFASVCIEDACLSGAIQWGASGGAFWDGQSTGSYQLVDGVLTIDYSGPDPASGHSIREVKHYVRFDDWAFGKNPPAFAPGAPQGDARLLQTIASSPRR